jgi:uncharacterized protein YfdQ (DUF2303 family)
VKRADSKWSAIIAKEENFIHTIKEIADLTSARNTESIQTTKAKDFIRSLTFINKSDSSQLDSSLKTFFLSFLSTRFPSRPSG